MGQNDMNDGACDGEGTSLFRNDLGTSDFQLRGMGSAHAVFKYTGHASELRGSLFRFERAKGANKPRAELTSVLPFAPCEHAFVSPLVNTKCRALRRDRRGVVAGAHRHNLIGRTNGDNN